MDWTPEQIATPEPHPEDFCDDCGRPNMTWWVDSERWNATYRDRGRNPIVCPQCFVTAYAEVHGHVNDGLWELRLDESSTLARHLDRVVSDV